MFYALNDISSLLTLKLPDIEFLSDEEKTSILESFEHRKCMALHAMHYASSILDPRQKGQNLSEINDIAGIEYIFNVATAIMPEETQQIMIELAQYRSNEGLWSNNFIWSTKFYISKNKKKSFTFIFSRKYLIIFYCFTLFYCEFVFHSLFIFGTESKGVNIFEDPNFC